MKLKTRILSIFCNIKVALKRIHGLAALSLVHQQKGYEKCMISTIKERYCKSNLIQTRKKRKVEQTIGILTFFSWLMVCQVGARVGRHMIKKELRKEIQDQNEDILMFVSILANIIMAVVSLGMRIMLKKQSLDNEPGRVFKSASFFVFYAFSVVQILIDGQTQLGIFQVLLNVLIISNVLPESAVLHHLLGTLICLSLLVSEWIRQKNVEDVAMIALVQVAGLVLIIKRRHLLSYVCTCSAQIIKKNQEQDRGEKEGYNEKSLFCSICCKPVFSGNEQTDCLLALIEEYCNFSFLLNNQTQTGYCIVDSNDERVLYSNQTMMNKSNTINLESLYRSISELEFKIDQARNGATGGVFQHENDSQRLRGQSSNSTFAFSQKNTRISQPSEQSFNISKFQGISGLPVSYKNYNASSNTKGILEEDEQEDNVLRGRSVQDQKEKKKASLKSTSLALSPAIKSDQDQFPAGLITARTGILVSPNLITDNKIDSPALIEQERFVHDTVLQGEDKKDCGKDTEPSCLRILSTSAAKNNQPKHLQKKEQPGVIKHGNSPIRSQKISSQFSGHPSKQDPFRHKVRTEIKGIQSNSEASRLSFFQRNSASSKPSSAQVTQDFPSGFIGIEFLSSPILKPQVKYSFGLVEKFGEFDNVEVIRSSSGILYLCFEGEDSRKGNLEQEMLEELESFQTKVFNSISHEFGTPLNCALNLLKICQTQLPAEVHSNLINPALSSIRVLKFSCSDFIDYSKIQTSQFSLEIAQTDIRYVLNKAAQYFTPLVKQQSQKGTISIDVSAEIDVPDIILSDPKRILQIIFNLLTNSLKNTQKGFINIKVSKENEEELRISISDSGIGIPNEKKQNLFQRTTIKNKRQETGGMGLIISNAIASKLSAQETGLMVSSQIGVGSSFSFLVSINQKYPADHCNSNSKKQDSQYSLLFSPLPAVQGGQNMEQSWQQNQSQLSQPKGSVNKFLRKSILGLSEYCKQDSLVNRDLNGSFSQVLPVSSIFLPISAGATAQRDQDSSSISIQTTLSEFEEFSPDQNKTAIAGTIHQFSSKLFPEQRIQEKRQERSINQIVREPTTSYDQQKDLSFGKSPLFSESLQFVNTSSQGLKRRTRTANDSFNVTNSIFTSPVPTIAEEEKLDAFNQEIPLTLQNLSMLSMNEEQQHIPKRHLKSTQLEILRKDLRTSGSQSPQNCGSSERLTPDVENLNSIKCKKITNFLAGLERDNKNKNSFLHRTDCLLSSTIKSVALKHYSEQFIRDTCEKKDKKPSCSKDIRPNRFGRTNSLEKSDSPSLTKSQESSNLIDSLKVSIAPEQGNGDQTENKYNLRTIQYKRSKCFSIQDQFLSQSDQIYSTQKEERIQRNSKRRRTKSEFGTRDRMTELKEALKQKTCKCADLLIVDDTQMNRHTLKLIISSKYNFVIEEATNGLEAVEKVEEMLHTENHCRTYKMIFMDIDMPVLNGYDATRQINGLLKQQGLFCPIIAHTAFDRSHCQSEMNECGMTDFAGKPIRPQVIESLFNRYIDISTVLGDNA